MFSSADLRVDLSIMGAASNRILRPTTDERNGTNWLSWLVIRVIPVLLATLPLYASDDECVRTFRSANRILTHMGGGTAWGDLNGDGLVDAVVAGGTAESAINRGNTTFETQRLPELDGGFTSTALIDDINGDGWGDLITENPRLIALGNGDGTFQTPVMSMTGSALFRFLGDGVLSLVIDPFRVVVDKPNADGSFSAVGSIDVGIEVERLTTGDFDGDGRTDVFMGPESGGSLYVAWNEGHFQFQVQSFLSGFIPEYVGTADIDGDGADEIVGLESGKLFIVSALNRTITVSTTAVDTPALKFGPGHNGGMTFSFMGAQDLDGDGRKDLVFTSNLGVVVLWNEDDRPFVGASTFAMPGISGVTITDVDGDGLADIVPTHGAREMRIIFGTTGTRALAAGRIDLQFMVEEKSDSNTVATSVSASDLNQDGFMDLIRSIPIVVPPSPFVDPPAKGAGADIWLGDGEGGFHKVFEHRLPYQDIHHTENQARVMDLDGDHHADLVVSSATHGLFEDAVIQILEGHGDGTFGPDRLTVEGFWILGEANIREDGRPSLLLRDHTVLYEAALEGGAFARKAIFDLDQLPACAVDTSTCTALTVSVLDVDRDGFDELIIHSYIDSVYLQQVDGTWRVLQILEGESRHAAVTDANNDGWEDLLLANWDVQLYLGSADGFHRDRTIDPPSFAAPTLLTDVNGDGLVDIVRVGYWGYGPLGIELNRGSGRFEPWEVVEVPREVRRSDLIFVDVNGDDQPDLVSPYGLFMLSSCSSDRRLRASAYPTVIQEGGQARILVAPINSQGRLSIVEHGIEVCTWENSYPFTPYSCETAPLSSGAHHFEVLFEVDGKVMRTGTNVTAHPPAPRQRPVRRAF